LERVLGNLLSNAIKYSPDGGEIAVTVEVEGRKGGGTEGGGDGEGEWAVLTVRDEGVGIPAGEVPKLFERFFRASNVAGRIAGTGVGLAGARQIVAQHGGTIAVASEEGRGSAFTVRLPLTAGDPGSAALEGHDDARSSTMAPRPTGVPA
jgi:signal transduction histidine kinase